jgi:MerR family transcriptional regulator, thiopeptide resistance regulator
MSRSALLYYDRLGLLRPCGRTAGDYRLYSEAEVRRLEQVSLYRGMGVPLKQIALLLEQDGADRKEQILLQQMEALGQQVAMLRDRQKKTLRLLEQIASARPAGRRGHGKGPRPATSARSPSSRTKDKETAMVNKDRWIEIMRAAGFTEADMRKWHREFERMEPDHHQEFLESLGIPAAEIARIRAAARN